MISNLNILFDVKASNTIMEFNNGGLVKSRSTIYASHCLLKSKNVTWIAFCITSPLIESIHIFADDVKIIINDSIHQTPALFIRFENKNCTFLSTNHIMISAVDCQIQSESNDINLLY